MIPFASQRGGGQDLAIHLENAHDNESVELYSLRGAIVDDLSGAFAEWEAQAHDLTKCKNYLYSLSINPREELTREQYMDFIGRVEQTLGLENQPRAIVFHVKNEREHCHVVFSRIDAEKERAVHMAFDHDKLMMITRQFARDHGLKLPDGYFKEKGRHEGKGQLLLHEKTQQETTGISKEERMEVIADLWRRSDSAKAFVAGLQDHGYVLCTGRRDYVLVDYYGQMNALPRMIDDKQVRTQHIREFLGDEFPPESLPDVDLTKEHINGHRKQFEEFKRSQNFIDKREQLLRAHEKRRTVLNLERTNLEKRQASILASLELSQRDLRFAMRSDYLREKLEIRQKREADRPQGLAAFLSKASGFDLVQKRVQRYRDGKRYQEYHDQQSRLKGSQEHQLKEMEYQQELQMLDLERRGQSLAQLEQRELRSLQTQELKSQRISHRAGVDYIPSVDLVLSPWGRKANIYKAKQKHTSDLSRVLGESARPITEPRSAPGLRRQFLQSGERRADNQQGELGNVFNQLGDESLGSDAITDEHNSEREKNRMPPRISPTDRNRKRGRGKPRK